MELKCGKERVTSNMHLNLHIKRCILDNELIYSFWLLIFERYNGMRGSLPNNEKI